MKIILWLFVSLLFTASTGVKYSGNAKRELNIEQFAIKSVIKDTFSSNRQRRKWSSPIVYYGNSMKTFRLLLSGDIETNPGPICPTCNKTVRVNSRRFVCDVCKNQTHQKCANSSNVNIPNARTPVTWTCHICSLSYLPFFNVRDLITPYVQTDLVQLVNSDHVDHLEILKANSNHLSICHLNVQSLASTFTEFEVMLHQHRFDIITLSETWLKNNLEVIKHITIPGYKMEYNNRIHKRGGGVGLYIHENLQYKIRSDITRRDESIEHMWLEVKGKTNPFLVAVFYQPSSNDADKQEWIQKFDSLLSFVITIWTGPIFVTGDMNIDLLKIDSKTTIQYKDTLERLGLIQHITKPTRKGKKLIDHVISNLPNIIHEDILPCDDISDHDAPYIICNERKPRFEPRYKYIRNEKNFDAYRFKLEVEQLPFNLVYAFDAAEDKLDVFNELFLSCLNRHAPLVKQKMTRPPAPWLNDLHIKEMQRERDRLRKQAHTTQLESDWVNFRIIRNEIKKRIRTSKATFYRKALSSKRPKEVWSTIHRILNPNPQKINADPDNLNQHFNNTAKRLLNSDPKSNEFLQNVISNLQESVDSFRIKEVSFADVRKVILGLRNDCSTGFDQLPSKFLKICVDEITSPLCNIINTSIMQCTFPRQWKISKISPIPKVNHPINASDYRPISILPILSKLYEKLIMMQMSSFLETEQLLHKNQSGFRKGHCTVTTCLKIKNDIIKAMDRGEVTLAVLADFSKAFDTVDFETLIRKLHSLRFSKSSLRLLTSYLSHRQQQVQINENTSSMLTVTNGVPQGSILGPILFNIYVHDMNAQTNAECVQYADDSSLYRHAKPKELTQCSKQMNDDLKAIQNWSHHSNLVFNAAKTKSMLFSTKQLARRHDLNFEIKSTNGETIERVSSFKLLGIVFVEDMTWNEYVKTTTTSAYATLKTLAKLKRYLSFDLRKQLAETLVLSKLDYGNALINNAPMYLHNQLQRMQNATASFVRKRYSKPDDVVALKWLPIKERIEFSIVKLAWKSVNSPDWPKFLPMQIAQPGPRLTRSYSNDKVKLSCETNNTATFEHEASKIFNNLPAACRSCESYKMFCKSAKTFLLDKATARNLV